MDLKDSQLLLLSDQLTFQLSFYLDDGRVFDILVYSKLDQETWLCRTHLDTFWVDFGPYWTNLDHSVFLDQFIWTRLFGSVSLDPSLWIGLF